MQFFNELLVVLATTITITPASPVPAIGTSINKNLVEDPALYIHERRDDSL